MGKQPKTLYDLKQNLGHLEEKRTRLLKDRDMLDHRLKAQNKRAALAYHEIKRFQEGQNKPKDPREYYECDANLKRNYTAKYEIAENTSKKLAEITKELKRTKSQIRQLKFDIKRLEQEQNK